MTFPYKKLRYLHLAMTPVLGAFVYSDALREADAFERIVQAAVFPLTAGAGLAMWLGPRLLRRARATPRSSAARG